MEEQKASKGADEQFCQSCGKVVKKEAVICVFCGVPIKKVPAPEPKDKAIAVLFAVFLSFWTWVYTYQKDAWKFWLNLALSILTCGIWWIVAWIWAIINTAARPSSWYKNYPNE